MLDYRHKYIKYKTKYLKLKNINNQIGSGKNIFDKINIINKIGSGFQGETYLYIQIYKIFLVTKSYLMPIY
jgi:hypothetical protein